MHAKRSLVCFIVLSAGLLWFSPLTLKPQLVAQEEEKKLSEESIASSDAREKRIRQELKQLKHHAWAGEYYYGDGLGVNVALILAPKSGFVFTWHGCLGLYDLNYGQMEQAGGKIRLIFTHPNDRKGFQGIAPELIPIVWGERHYLVPADEVVDFANAINAGSEPRKSLWGEALLKRGDETKTAQGRPSIPPKYSEYLLDYPIEAKISSIKSSSLEDSRRVTSFVLDVGSAQHVKVGMEFYVYAPPQYFGSARITRVENNSSEAEMVDYFATKDPGPPSPGWKLSTRIGRD
jgi:hypothetical protein